MNRIPPFLKTWIHTIEGIDMPPMTAAERKRRQREQDRREGIREVTVRVPAEGAEKVRELAARLMRERFPGA